MKKIFSRLIFSIALLINTLTFTVFANAYDVRFEHIGIEQGLSQSSVVSILQDRDGFLWFGTQDGLDKFDGYKFTIYKNDPFDSTSLSDNWVSVIQEDREGHIWIGTHNGGLLRFDKTTRLFKRFQNEPENPHSLSSNRVWSAYEDKSGVLWIGTSLGLNRYHPETGDFERFLPATTDSISASTNAVNAILGDRAGKLWIGTWGRGLFLFDPSIGKFTPVQPKDGDSKNPGSEKIKCIIRDHKDNLWIGTWESGLFRRDIANGKWTHFNLGGGLNDNHILSLMEDSRGDLWVGTHHGGVYKLDRQGHQLAHLEHDSEKPFSLSDNWVPAIYEDLSGNIWIGTGNGLSKYNKRLQAFIHFQSDPTESNSLNNHVVNAIYEDHLGDVWIGTWGGGLNRLIFKKRGVPGPDYTFKYYLPERNTPNRLSHEIVWTIIEDREKNLWVGTYYGLNMLDPAREKITHYFHERDKPNSLSNNNISALLEDKSGNLWIGTWGGGLNYLNPKTNEIRHFLGAKNDSTSLSDNLVTALFQDQDGRLWVGTAGGGLNLFDKKHEKFRSFKYDPSDLTSLSNNSVKCIYQDRSGTMWIGTGGGGLDKIVFTDRGPAFKHYTEKQGLPNNMINGILEDGRGNLWISTNRGLAQFNPQSQLFRKYSARDGLQSDEFGGGRAKLKNGALLFGGVNGFNLFYPDSLQMNKHIPPIVLTDFTLFNRNPRLDRPLSDLNKIVLSYKEDMISFEFAALDYTFPEKNLYRYQMEGVDKEWMDAGGHRRVTYTLLKPGQYVFRVMGSNNDGIWNTEGTSISIIIQPPFWQTWWFRILMLLFIMGSLVLIFRLRIHQIEIKKKNLEVLVAERTSELRQKNRDLEEALVKIKTLRGLLPICASCKKIRDDKGYWNQIEKYIREHSEAEFSHSICPDCAQKLYPELFNGGEGESARSSEKEDE